MAIKFNRSQTFATNGTVTAAGLHNLVDGMDIYQALITDQTNLASVGTGDKLLIADSDLSAGDAPRSTTVLNLFDDALTAGTYTDLNLTGNLTAGTSTTNRTIATSATITTGTIPNATLGTTTGTAATFTTATLGTTTATAANITNGTVQTLTSSTLASNLTGGTFGGLVNGSVNSSSGTIATLNSTTGTIGNFSTTLAGDFTISQGTGTLGTSGVTSGTYGTSTAIPSIVVDSKGRITSASTVAFTSGKILQVASTSKTDVFSTTSTSFTDITGLSVSITPSSATNKILVICDTKGASSGNSSTRLMRDSTAIHIGTGSLGNRTASGGGDFFAGGGSPAYGNPVTHIALDSPGTTSSITYKLQLKSDGNTAAINTSVAGDDNSSYNFRGASSITVIEVQA